MSARLRADYLFHDRLYAERKADSGLSGWSSEQQVAIDVAELSELFSRAYMPKGRRVLEIGCGAGEVTLWLAEQGFEAHGIDIAPTAIAWATEKARARGVRATFETASVFDLPRSAFDIVVDGHCLHCIIPAVSSGETRNDRERCLSAVLGALTPGGVFRVNSLVGAPPRDGLDGQWFDPVTRCRMMDGPNGPIAIRYHAEPDEILAELRAVGFDVRWAQMMPGDERYLLVDAIRP